MELNDSVQIGQVVKSKAGRDKGRVFLIYGVADKEHVYVVDGDLRRLDNPKKKKLKHLSVYNKVLTELQYRLDNNFTVNNAYIRKLLEPFN